MKRSTLFKRNVETQNYTVLEIDEIIKCQKQVAYLEEQANAGKIQIVKKYNQLKQTHFKRRSELLVKLEKFWLTTFQNHPILAYDIVDVEGQDCLDYLQNLTLEDEVEVLDSNQYTFTIYFYFNDNPYFFNDVLWKKFTITVQGKQSSNISDIKWKEGMNPNTRRECNNSRKRKPAVCRFLEWFTDSEKHQSNIIVDAIRDDIWQNPSLYYVSPNTANNDLKSSCSVILPQQATDDDVIILSSDDDMDIDENIPDAKELKKCLREVENWESSDECESESTTGSSGLEHISTEDSDSDKTK